MDAPVADSRHVRGAGATLQVTWTDEWGEAAAAFGAVTVRVQRADGTDIVAAGSSTIGSNPYSRALAPALTATLDLLTATWTDANTGATRTTLHDIVGGVYITVADLRAWDPAISQQVADDTTVRTRRTSAEQELELITGVAWVPKYRRLTLDGTGDQTLTLDDPAVRTVRSVRVYTGPASFTTYNAGQLAKVIVNADGTLTRIDDVFDQGTGNVIVEYEHGHNRPPEDLLDAFKIRVRDKITRPTSGVQDRAETFQMAQGGTLRFAQPGLYTTGIPDVDGVYRRYSERETQIVSRALDFDPTRGSLFHGGRQ